MRFSGRTAWLRVLRCALFVVWLVGAAGAGAQQLVTDAPVAKTGGTAYVGKWTSTSVFSAGPTFHFTAAVTITSVAYDPGPGGVRELGIGSLNGCSYNEVTPAGTICDVVTEIASQYPGMRYGTLRITTTTGIFTIPVAFQAIGAQVAVTPGTLSVPQGASGLSGSALAVDALGNMYLSGLSDGIVRKIDGSSGAVTIFAGTLNNPNSSGDGSAASASVGNPFDVATSPAGDVYIVSTSPSPTDPIRKVDGGTGTITTVAEITTGRVPAVGNSIGPGTDGAVAIDDQGKIYATSTRLSALTVTPGDQNKPVFLIGKNEVDPASAGCNTDFALTPSSLAVSDGYVYFSTAAAVYKISTDTSACHAPVLVAGTGIAGNSGDGGLATKAAIGSVNGLAVDAAGDVYLADLTNQTVRVVNAATGTISTIAGAGSAVPNVTISGGSSSLALDVRGNVYVLGANGIQKIDVATSALHYVTTPVQQTSSDSPQAVVFTNIGNDTLPNALPSTPSSDFPLDLLVTSCAIGNATSLAAGASCVAGADFKPTTTGAMQGSLSFGGVHVALSGTATAAGSAPADPTVSITPQEIHFGSVSQGGTSGTWTVWVGNTGGSPLNLADIALSDSKNFVLGGTCGARVAAYSSCNLTVAFKPQTTGTLNATITLTDDASTRTQTITLTGKAAKPSYSVIVNPNVLTVQGGQSGVAQFVFVPTGGYVGTVNFACAGLPVGASCSFAPASMTADGSDTQQASQLTVTTGSASNPVAANVAGGKGITLVALMSFNVMLLLTLKLRRGGTLSLQLMGVLLLLSFGVAGATGCGAGGTAGGFTPAVSTTVSVITTSASGSSQAATFTLTVR